MYKQVLDPVSHSLGLTSIFALVPLAVLFVLLGIVRLKAQWAALITLGVAILVALIVYSMPIGQAGDAALEGAAFGFWPIMWIVINALWIFNMTDATGYFAVLRRAFARVSDDIRVQVVMIAFCFGALLEALAGFGTPVAICGIMLVGLGVKPIKAAAVALVADTAPVAFGAIAIPITTLGTVTGLPVHQLGQMVGRQTPLLALLVPFVLVFMTDGRRGLREAWPAALTAGVVFAVLQFAISNFVSVELTDIIASLGSAAALLALLRVWSPASPLEVASPAAAGQPAIAGGSTSDPAFERTVKAKDDKPLTARELALAFAPYVIIIIVLGLISLKGIATDLDKATSEFSWPGLHVLNAKGKAPTSLIFKLNWLTAAGTALFVSGVITAIVLRVSPGKALRVYAGTLNQLKWAIMTVCTVLAVAYVMNLSGQSITLGTWAAGAGGFFAFLSPLIGWFGTAVTGHLDQLAVRRAAGGRRQAVRPLPHAAGRRQQLRWRARQDGLAPEPGDRSRGRRPRRPGGRHLPQGDRLEPGAGASDGDPRAPAVDLGPELDGALGTAGRGPRHTQARARPELAD
jgi:lactate permease